MTTIELRRGTAAAWTSANPVLAAGEPGFETDTGKHKIGDGSTTWTSLGYAAALPSDVTALSATLGAVVGSVSAGATQTLDCSSQDRVETLTLTADCTLTLTPPTSGVARKLTLFVVQDGTGGRLLTFASSGTQSVLWDSGSPPQLSAGPGKVDKLTLTTVAAGTPWYGQVDAIDLR